MNLPDKYTLIVCPGRSLLRNYHCERFMTLLNRAACVIYINAAMSMLVAYKPDIWCVSDVKSTTRTMYELHGENYMKEGKLNVPMDTRFWLPVNWVEQAECQGLDDKLFDENLVTLYPLALDDFAKFTHLPKLMGATAEENIRVTRYTKTTAMAICWGIGWNNIIVIGDDMHGLGDVLEDNRYQENLAYGQTNHKTNHRHKGRWFDEWTITEQLIDVKPIGCTFARVQYG